MTSGAEVTVAGMVNSWECDENAHMNVQFYWSRFEQADHRFRLSLGRTVGTGIIPESPASRHVRYHSELRGAGGLRVASRLAEDGEGHLSIQHALIDTDLDVLSATALQMLKLDPNEERVLRDHRPVGPALPQSLPRSIRTAPGPFGSKADVLLARGGTIACRAVVEAGLCRDGGVMSDRGIVALSVEAGPACWAHGGAARPLLRELGLGRVAVEKRLTILRRPRIGEAVDVIAQVVAVEQTTFTMRHSYFDAGTGDLLAVCEVTALAMHLATRKAVRLPEATRLRMQQLVAATMSPQSDGT